MLIITNTKTGKKEEFISLTPHKVLMYVCGITPYDAAHLGHGRCYVSFDLLYRLLQFLGYSVTYCRNFTDIDDKLIRRAQERLGDGLRYAEIADQYIKSYHEDMAALGNLPPTYEPRVTDNIPQIIRCVEKLIERGYAYESGGSVYFSISEFPQYGVLSKHNLADLRAGARVEVSEEKRDPLDFALWKAETEGTFWKSPWGWGRPGWHIECSALARTYLGETIDIHGGGLDLVFPHHENEIAQSEALMGHVFARYWMHNGFVQLNEKKMSKSLGNFFTLRDVYTEYDPQVLRYYYLTHHYRAPLEFAFDDLKATGVSYKKLIRFFVDTEPAKQIKHELPVVAAMRDALCNDLNTPAAFGVLFESLPLLEKDGIQRSHVKALLQTVFGLKLQPVVEKTVALTPEMERLIAEREQARADKNWARADALRDQLAALGYKIQDKKI
jgi:cysteinyl-tRNA synthetase